MTSEASYQIEEEGEEDSAEELQNGDVDDDQMDEAAAEDDDDQNTIGEGEEEEEGDGGEGEDQEGDGGDGGEEDGEERVTSWGKLDERDDDYEGEKPDDIALRKPALSMELHPSRNILAVGLVGGRVECHEFDSKEGNTQLYSIRVHKKSTTALTFSNDGLYLYSGSADKSMSVMDVETGKVVTKQDKAHSHGIYSLLSYEHMLASGDDEGVIKLWDLRTKKPSFSFSDCEDYISSMTISPERNRLLAASADGTLSVINLKAGKLEDRSDQLEDELLSVAIVKNGSKVVCGSQGGIINIFSWGQWGDISDRFPGHPDSIDCILPVDNDGVVLTGSFDGLIRVVQIQPNKLLGVVGEHEENGIGIPIEHMSFSHDRSFLASTSHDQIVKFWDVRYLFEESLFTGEEEDEDIQEDQQLQKGKRQLKQQQSHKEEEADTLSSSSSSTSSSKQQQQQQQQQLKQKKRRKGKKSFFSGL
eukprot:TRINITY_DN1183_c0_g3_i1.p1 TRINITY_DN1183_c0_g3~~TRINITY_DN1183_c0_g3_i1.p1  ORF type:complete len:474 (+),score=167.90 TRINITY_DN1183_c0_g3_i1:77-1498(+)